MGEILRTGWLKPVVHSCFASGFLLALAAAPATVTAQEKPGTKTAQALFVNDIHFEPFWDPGKVAQLAAAPVKEWNAILSSPDSADQHERFAALQQTCRARGVDTNHALYDSSLRAMRTDAAGAKFIVLGGDLQSHGFACKFATVFPNAKPGEFGAFAEKTIDYVMSRLRGAFPGVPLYATLGNNDSDCGDFKLDAHGEFLRAESETFVANLVGAERTEALRTFAAEGDYGVLLPAPMQHTRLLVLDDLFMAERYETCGGKDDPGPAAEQIAWLKQQLNEARAHKEKIWVMAHIPPGVNPYSTATKGKDVCKGNKPTMYMSSEALGETMADYSDVIRLGIFAHSHMDEMKFLEPASSGAGEDGIAIKIGPSISPVDGNNPAFTVAQIDPAASTLKDYRVIEASNKTGIDTTWAEEYDFAETYKEPAFTATTIGSLIQGFQTDRGAQTSASRSYIHNYGVGMATRELGLVWPMYVCAMKDDTADAFTECVCRK